MKYDVTVCFLRGIPASMSFDSWPEAASYAEKCLKVAEVVKVMIEPVRE